MRKLRFNTISISAIFEYPNPIDASLFHEHLKEEEWFRGRRGRRPPDRDHDSSIVIDDVRLDYDSVHQLGVTERANILYANNTSLPDFGNCAFLTVSARRSYNIEAVLQELDRVVKVLSEIDMVEQLVTFEMHVDSNVRVKDEQDIDVFLNDGALDRITEILGANPRGQKLTLKSRDSDSSVWYRLSIDLTENMNPLLWGIDYQRRFEEVEGMKESEIKEDIEDMLSETINSDAGGDDIE